MHALRIAVDPDMEMTGWKLVLLDAHYDVGCAVEETINTYAFEP